MKFSNTKQNFKDVGKDLVNLTKHTLHIPVAIHKDFSFQRSLWKQFQEYQKSQESTSNAHAHEDNTDLTLNVKSTKKGAKANA